MSERGFIADERLCALEARFDAALTAADELAAEVAAYVVSNPVDPARNDEQSTGDPIVPATGSETSSKATDQDVERLRRISQWSAAYRILSEREQLQARVCELEEALREIESECFDSDWTPERMEHGLKRVHNRAIAALETPRQEGE